MNDQSIDIVSHLNPIGITPFVSVYISRGRGNIKIHYNPTPSTMLRLMRWQAATLLAGRKVEAKP